MTRVWLIESKEEGEWYSCWYEVFYTRKEAESKIKELRDQTRHTRTPFRAARYVRAPHGKGWDDRPDY